MRYVTAVLLTLLVCLTAGCGLASKAVDKAAEKATEKAIEKATGVSVDQDKNSVTLKGQDGQQVTISGSEDGKVPEGFPLAIYKGGKVTNSTVMDADSKRGWTVQIELNAEVKDVADFYEKALKDRGVELNRVDSTNNGETSVMLMGQSDKETGWVSITRNGSEPTTVSILWGSK